MSDPLARVRWLGLLCMAVLVPQGAAVAAPYVFTLETAEQQVRKTHPAITRPDPALPVGIGMHEAVPYASVGGETLALDIYRPAQAADLAPAVLVVHGGGWVSGSRQMERPLAARLAASGFVAVTVSYRLGPTGRFPAALHDLKAAVRWLRVHAAAYGIDAGHIGAIGASAGGQLVALLGASNGDAALEGEVGERGASSEVQAVVDIDGLVDFTAPELVAQQVAAPGGPTQFLGGSFAARPEVWRQASALCHVGPRSAPTLFLNSTAASLLLPGRPAMCDRLRGLGIDSSLVVVPDTPHPFWLFEPWFSRVLRESENFLHRHLTAHR